MGIGVGKRADGPNQKRTAIAQHFSTSGNLVAEHLHMMQGVSSSSRATAVKLFSVPEI